MKKLLSLVFLLFFISLTIATVYAAPATPTDLRATGVTGNSVSLMWNPAADAKDLRSYLVTYTDNATTQTQRVPVLQVNDNKTTITGLTPNTPYTFTVAACVSDADCSAASAPVTETPKGGVGKKNLGELCTPGADECSSGLCVIFCVDPRTANHEADISKHKPKLVYVGKTGDSISLRIDEPDPNVDMYSIYYRKQGDTEYTVRTTVTPNFVVSGLSPKSTYTIHVRGANKKFATENSVEVTETTLERTQNEAASCTTHDCAGSPCVAPDSYCQITSNKGEPLACGCTKPPPPPSPPCEKKDANGICQSLTTAIGDIATTPVGLAKTLFGIVLSLAGGIAVILLITAGYQIMTSAGEPEKIQGAKDTITSTIIGLVFIIFSLVVLQIIGIDILRIPGLQY